MRPHSNEARLNGLFTVIKKEVNFIVIPQGVHGLYE